MDPKKAQEIRNSYGKLPSIPFERVRIVNMAYGPKIDGVPVTELDDGQLFYWSNKALNEAYQTQAPEEKPWSIRDASADDLGHWASIAQRDKDLPADERGISPKEASEVLLELARRKARK